MNLKDFTDINKAAKWFQAQPHAEINRMVAEAGGCASVWMKDELDEYVWRCGCIGLVHSSYPGIECDTYNDDTSPWDLKDYATSVDAMLEVVRKTFPTGYDLGEYEHGCYMIPHIKKVWATPYFPKDKAALALAFAVCWYKRLEDKS